MTATIVIRCDGTPADRPSIPLGQCRAALPTHQTRAVDGLDEALRHGWTVVDGRDLCPSCTRAREAR